MATCCSQLLQRAACAHAHGVPFEKALVSRTKGGKPFLVRARGHDVRAARADAGPQANPAAHRPHAPNWNFNVSHEGARAPTAASCARRLLSRVRAAVAQAIT
jgi:phosphopantetheinyl transferase